MQKTSFFIAAIILVMIAASLFLIPRLQPNKQDARLEITVTTNIIADAVREIAGDTVIIHCLMQPGVDPHSYHARLSDMRAMLRADIIIYNGLHLEGKMATVFHKMHAFKPTYAISDALKPHQLIVSEEFEEIYDPHIWFDVALWKQVVTYITDLLCAHNATHAELYQTRMLNYLQELTELEHYISATVAHIPPANRYLITTHDAFSYFGRAYDITVFGLQGVNLDAEPCIKNMHELIELICTHNIPTIFIESSLPTRSMQAIAQAVFAQGRTINIGEELYSDTLGTAESDAHNYAGMLKHNTHALVRGLNPLYTII